MRKIFVAVCLLFALFGTAYAETHTEFVTGNPITTPDRDWNYYVIKNTLNFGDLDTPGPYATGILAGVSRFGETVQLLDIPAGTLVSEVGVNLYSPWGTGTAAAVGGSGTGVTMYGVTIGDGTDADGWITAVDFGPTASGVSSSAEEGIAGIFHTTYGGKVYTAADTIDAVLPVYAHRAATFSGLTDFVVQIWAKCVDLSNVNENYGTTQ